MSESETVTIAVEFTASQAWQFAQFLKRSRLDTYREYATSDDEAYLMTEAAGRVQRALAEKGVAPR